MCKKDYPISVFPTKAYGFGVLVGLSVCFGVGVVGTGVVGVIGVTGVVGTTGVVGVIGVTGVVGTTGVVGVIGVTGVVGTTGVVGVIGVTGVLGAVTKTVDVLVAVGVGVEFSLEDSLGCVVDFT
jgi:hypothetical protein